jgi:hypothetical protein
MTFLDDALNRVPVERITREAREIHFWRTVLTLVAGLLYGVGWVVAKLFTGFWLVLTWCFTAVRLGWQEGRRVHSPQ